MTTIYSRNELKASLKEGKWDVDFIKVDGSLASMTCTLDPQIIPAVFEESEKPSDKTPVNETILRVYSTDREGWRSFKVANVQNITKL